MKNKNYPTADLKASYWLPCVSLAWLAAILIIIAIPYLRHWLNHSLLFSFLTGLLDRLRPALIVLTLFLTVVLLVMLAIVFRYQHGNSFRNYCLSWFQTFELRNFAKIPAKIEQIKENDVVKNRKITDPYNQVFNYAIKGWYVDVRTDILTIWLLIPSFSDSQVILDQKLPTIESKIRQDNPGYTFSPAERVGNFYKIEATRY
ncbi:hypothetical protein [Lactobacillus sp.]|uniref:hypothetical protein n=1 Tax=Lactobacillus sp. TaxID=1591 RepID=UPI0025F7BA8D|nr:hypothetical protein [Lactobacillus sp.]MCO6531440.1 hypothetical protein [Lactobacillus sp.]